MIRGLVGRERLLEWTVEDGWEPLCEFLGKPVPNEPFPHVNAAAGWAGQEMRLAKKYIVGAAINVGTFCIIAAGAWAIYSRYW